MFGLVGMPLQRIEEVRDWLEIVSQSFSLDPALFPQIDRAFNALWSFVDDLLVEHSPAEDGTGLLDALVVAERDGTLDRTEARDLLLFLFVAGYDTSKNQLAHIVNLAGRPPRAVAALRRRPHVLRLAAVDEALRHSGVATSYRNVAEALTWRDMTIEAGTMLIFPMGIVGRSRAPFAILRLSTPPAPTPTATPRSVAACTFVSASSSPSCRLPKART